MKYSKEYLIKAIKKYGHKLTIHVCDSNGRPDRIRKCSKKGRFVYRLLRNDHGYNESCFMMNSYPELTNRVEAMLDYDKVCGFYIDKLVVNGKVLKERK